MEKPVPRDWVGINKHIIPKDDLVAHEASPRCVCGPELFHMITGIGRSPAEPMYEHFPLDGIEFTNIDTITY